MNACLKVAIGNNLKKRNVFKKIFNFLAYNCEFYHSKNFKEVKCLSL
ncbi:hypothetical protein HPCPY1662_0018 [Helicobacter pylori CPY1662]|nr:hypothetical protein HPCPY1662_0018 [Helicobacter pylori CPY1662]